MFKLVPQYFPAQTGAVTGLVGAAATLAVAKPTVTVCVLVAESDWNAIQETLRLLALPGMRESIREGLATPLYKCDTKLEW